MKSETFLSPKGNKLKVHPPDENGYGIVTFNDCEIARVRYDDAKGVTLQDGRTMPPLEFGKWLFQLALDLDQDAVQ